MNNNVDTKAENTYTFSGKTEDWKLSSRKLNAIARKQGWQDALDKTKMGTLITKSEYDTYKALGAANLTPGQASDVKLYEDNLELTNEFIMGLKGKSQHINVILQKLDDTKTDEYPDGVLITVVEELNGDMQMNEEVAQDIVITKLEKIVYNNAKQYKEDTEKVIAESNTIMQIENKERLKILRKAVAASAVDDKRQIIKDIMEEQSKTNPSFKETLRRMENLDDLANLEGYNAGKKDRKDKEIQLMAVGDRKEGGYRQHRERKQYGYQYRKQGGDNDRNPKSQWNQDEKGGRNRRKYGKCPHCEHPNANHPPEKCFDNPANRKRPNKYKKADARGTSVDIQMNQLEVLLRFVDNEPKGSSATTSAGLTEEQNKRLQNIMADYGLTKHVKESESKMQDNTQDFNQHAQYDGQEEEETIQYAQDRITNPNTPYEEWKEYMLYLTSTSSSLQENLQLQEMDESGWEEWYETNKRFQLQKREQEYQEATGYAADDSSMESESCKSMPVLVKRKECDDSTVSSDGLSMYSKESTEVNKEKIELKAMNDVMNKATEEMISSDISTQMRYADMWDKYPHGSMEDPAVRRDLASINESPLSVEAMTDNQRIEEEIRATKATTDTKIIGIKIGTVIAVPHKDAVGLFVSRRRQEYGFHDERSEEMLVASGQETTPTYEEIVVLGMTSAKEYHIGESKDKKTLIMCPIYTSDEASDEEDFFLAR